MTCSGRTFGFCVQMDGSCLLISSIAIIIRLKANEVRSLGTEVGERNLPREPEQQRMDESTTATGVGVSFIYVGKK